MNAWLLGAAVLILPLAPLSVLAARRAPEDGLVLLEACGVNVALAFLLIALGTDRDAVGDLALVMAAASLVGSLAFATLLEREP